MKKYVKRLVAGISNLWSPPQGQRSSGDRSQVEALEPRLLYSADLTPIALLDNPLPALEVAQLSQAGTTTAHTQLAIEVVVIDSKVSDVDLLLADIKTQQAAGRNIAILEIGADDDGLESISRTLSQLSSQGLEISALHIISHGGDGEFELGNRRINDSVLRQFTLKFSEWSAAFTPDADILIYGCDFAETEKGLVFAKNLAAVTGADVAGNKDKTGDLNLSGDWTLDYRTGDVEAATAISGNVQGQWHHLLTLTPIANPTPVNVLTTGPQSTGLDIVSQLVDAESTGGNKIAVDNNGNYVVAWIENGAAKIQFFNAANVLQTALPITLPESLSAAGQSQVAVAMNGSGEVVVSWTQGTGFASEIYAQRFSSSGAAGTRFLITSNNFAAKSAVAINDLGEFVVAWQQAVPSFQNEIFIQTFDAFNVGFQTNFSGSLAGNQTRPSVSMRGSVGVVAWQDGNSNQIVFRSVRLDTGSAYYGSATQASNGVSPLNQRDAPDIAINTDNKVVITWQANDGVNFQTLYSVFQESTNTFIAPVPIQSESQVNPFSTRYQALPKVAISNSGEFVIAQQTANQQPDGAGWGIFARSFNAIGTALETTETSVNFTAGSPEFSLGNQFAQSIAWRNGNVVTAWTSDSSSNTKVFSRQVSFTAERIFVVTTNNDVIDANDGVLSLREAIVAANSTFNLNGIRDKITFQIPGSGQQIIQLNNALPPIQESIDIDGYSQFAFNAGEIRIIDNSASNATFWLTNTSSGSRIDNLAIENPTGIAILITGSANTITRNTITNSRNAGIWIAGNSSEAANSNTLAKNTIFNNAGAGLKLRNSSGNQIEENTIYQNTNAGIDISTSQLGLSSSNNRVRNNVIGQNGEGIAITAVGSTDNEITRNFIGVDRNLAAFGNSNSGVRIALGAAGNAIGGSSASDGNVIAENGINGVRISNGLVNGPTLNSILGNSIYRNGAIGINVDAVEGIQTPTIYVAVQSGSSTRIEGVFQGIALSSYRIEFFSTPKDVNGVQGSGKTFLGFLDGGANAAGDLFFFTNTLPAVPIGHLITATATLTDATHTQFSSTSNFSAPRPLGGQFTIDEGTSQAFNISAYTGFTNLTGLTYSLVNTHDSIGWAVDPLGLLYPSPPADYETLLADVTGSNDNILWIHVNIFDGVTTETVIHIIEVADKNDAPIIASTPSIAAIQGATVNFLGSDRVTVNDPDTGPLAAATPLTLTIKATTLGGATPTGTLSFNGQLDNIVSATGTVAQLNNYLAALQFSSDPNETRSAQLEFLINDGGSGFGAFAALPIYGYKNIIISPPANVPPTITGLPSNVIYVENSGAAPLFGSANLLNSDGPSLTALTISYTQNLDLGQEFLLPPNPSALGSLVFSHDLSARLITITGQANTADYQSLLRSITYTNFSEAPTSPNRKFSVSINDGVDISATSTLQMAVAPVNDAPVLSFGSVVGFSTPFGSAFNFNNGLEAAMTISDPDLIAGFFTLNVSLPVSPSGSTLSYSSTLMNAIVGAGLTVTGPASGGNSLTFFGVSSKIKQAIALVTYNSGSGHVGAETINFNLNDNGNSGGGTPLTSQKSIVITTAPQANTAPTVTGNISNQSFIENSAGLAIFRNIVITDTQQSNLTEVRVATGGAFFPSEDGQPQFSSVAGGIQSSRNGNLLTLSGNFPIADYEQALRSLIFFNISDTPSQGVRTFTLDVFDGTLWSSPVSTLVEVTAVDDPTVLSLPATQTVAFGQTLILAGAPTELYLVDPDAGSKLYEMSVSVQHGSLAFDLSLGGTMISMRGSIGQLNALLQQQRISYQPNSGFSGTDQLVIEIREIDFTLDLAFPTTAAAANSTIIVSPGIPPEFIDYAPKAEFVENGSATVLHPALQIIGGNGNILTGAVVRIVSGFDPSGDFLSAPKAPDGIFVEWDSVAGTLTFSNPASKADYALALASVSFNSLSDNPGDQVRVVSFIVSDALQSSREINIEVRVEPVNDAPTLAVPTLFTRAEDTPLSFEAIKSIGVSDVDDNQLVLTIGVDSGTLRWIGATPLPAGVTQLSSSQLSFSGSSLNINQWAHSFEFLPPVNFNGTATIQWSITDDHGAVTVKSTAVQITAVNDLPIWQGSQGLALNQGQTVPINSQQTNATDIEDLASQLTYELNALPSHGSLFKNGVALTLASAFTQADINSGAISYQHNNGVSTNDAFSFAVKDSAGGRTEVKTVAISVASVPIVVIAPTGNGGTGGTGGTGGNGGTGNTGGTPGAVSTGGSGTAPISPTATTDTKSIAGTEQAANGNNAQNAGAQTSTSSSTQRTPSRSSISSGNQGNASQGENGFGSNVNFSPNAVSNNRLIDTGNLALQSTQQASTSGPANTGLRNDQTLNFGLLRTRTVAENSEYAAIIRATINNQAFTEELQKIRDDAAGNLKLDRNVVASTTAVSATLSIGYVIWLVRGGALLSSLLASIPAWRMVDPLPILGSMDGGDSDVDDDSLDAMIEKSRIEKTKALEQAAIPLVSEVIA